MREMWGWPGFRAGIGTLCRRASNFMVRKGNKIFAMISQAGVAIGRPYVFSGRSLALGVARPPGVALGRPGRDGWPGKRPALPAESVRSINH